MWACGTAVLLSVVRLHKSFWMIPDQAPYTGKHAHPYGLTMQIASPWGNKVFSLPCIRLIVAALVMFRCRNIPRQHKSLSNFHTTVLLEAWRHTRSRVITAHELCCLKAQACGHTIVHYCNPLAIIADMMSERMVLPVLAVYHGSVTWLSAPQLQHKPCAGNAPGACNLDLQPVCYTSRPGYPLHSDQSKQCNMHSKGAIIS